ncbi:MAG: DUF3048 domain-containing protein [Candidatus Gracilibacteria bacterium]|nr:DUF3048 domain-containing protein [Candidatus Gracilibacteria bacterium]
MDFSFLRKRKALWITISSAFVLLLVLVFGGRLYFEYKVNGRYLPSGGNETAAFWGSDETAGIDSGLLKNLSNPPSDTSLLNGVSYTQAKSNEIIAAIIENHPAARPQMLGLREASLVIEALAEGGITRYLAFFDKQLPPKVGPIRSARPYFVTWSGEIADMLIHAGGSDAALQQLAKSDLVNLDENMDSEILFRDFRYLKPHNLFANLAAAEKLLAAQKKQPTLTQPRFDFSDEIPSNTQPITTVSLNFSLPSYLVDYVYDAKQENYQRLLGGVIHADADKNPITPKNIVIQFTTYTLEDEATGHLDFKTTGEGIAWYFSEGKYWQGVWRKIGSLTEFLNMDRQPVSFPAGQTFIEVIDKTSLVTKR